MTRDASPRLNGDAPWLVALGGACEVRFRRLIDALELVIEPRERGVLRRRLLGAMNGSRAWCHPGREPPAAIARTLIARPLPEEVAS